MKSRRMLVVLLFVGGLSSGACNSTGSASGRDGSTTNTGLTIDVIIQTSQTCPNACPVAIPNPASVKTGEYLRWANLGSCGGDGRQVPCDAGLNGAPAITTVDSDGMPFETVEPGASGGIFSFQSAGTYTYTISTTPALNLSCVSDTGCSPPAPFTLHVTAN